MNSYSIQYVRAVAALSVVFYHAIVYLERMYSLPMLHGIFGGRPGTYGVVAFFVVSGYLMATIAPKYTPSTFLAHRITRIYPIYWLTVAAAIIFFYALWNITKPNAGYVPDIGTMLMGRGSEIDILRLTLTPIKYPDFPLGIEWTLLYETTFYVFVYLVSFFGYIRYLQHISLVWLALIIGAFLVMPNIQGSYIQPNLLTLPTLFINAAFIFGILGPKIEKWIPPYFSIAFGVVVLVVTDVVPSPVDMIQVCFGVFGIVIGVIALERRKKIPRIPFLIKIGDWSYALYLIHVPIIIATYKLVPQMNQFLLIGIAMILTVAVSSAVGVFDLKLYSYLKSRIDNLNPEVQKLIAILFLIIFMVSAHVGLHFNH